MYAYVEVDYPLWDNLRIHIFLLSDLKKNCFFLKNLYQWSEMKYSGHQSICHVQDQKSRTNLSTWYLPKDWTLASCMTIVPVPGYYPPYWLLAYLVLTRSFLVDWRNSAQGILLSPPYSWNYFAGYCSLLLLSANLCTILSLTTKYCFAVLKALL